MAIEYAMLFTTKRKDETGMYTYTCNKRERGKGKQPVRRTRSAGLDTEQKTGVIVNQGKKDIALNIQNTFLIVLAIMNTNFHWCSIMCT
jgi:hypothetical protein